MSVLVDYQFPPWWSVKTKKKSMLVKTNCLPSSWTILRAILPFPRHTDISQRMKKVEISEGVQAGYMFKRRLLSAKSLQLCNKTP